MKKKLTQLFATLKFDECIELAKEIGDLEDPFICKLVAFCHLKLGNLTTSLELFLKLNTIYPTDDELLYTIGKVYTLKKEYDYAETFLIKALSLAKDRYDFKIALAEVLMSSSKYEQCESLLNDAIALNPNYVEAYNMMGALMHQTSRMSLSLGFFKRSLELNSDQVETLYNCAECHYLLREPVEALNLCEKALSLNPNYARALTLAAKINFEIGNRTVSKKLLVNALQAPRYSYETMLLLGIIYAEEGNLEESLRLLTNASQINNTDIMADLVLNLLRRSAEEEMFDFSLQKKPKIESLVKKKLKVRPELLTYLLNKHSFDLNSTSDPSYGKATGSDYKLFDDTADEVANLKRNLTDLISSIFDGQIYYSDSFYSIFTSGGGTKPHNHLNALDKVALSLESRKYSLVYYLAKGDQSGPNPGYLELFDPSEKFLPSDGSIVIFPASRSHCSYYDGQSQRVLLGVNFYVV